MDLVSCPNRFLDGIVRLPTITEPDVPVIRAWFCLRTKFACTRQLKKIDIGKLFWSLVFEIEEPVDVGITGIDNGSSHGRCDQCDSGHKTDPVKELNHTYLQSSAVVVG